MTSETVKVLLVEGDEALALDLARVLRSQAYDVALAASAGRALEMPAPDVVVSELELDDGSAFQLLASLKRRGVRCGSVLLTGDPTVDQCRLAMRLGASELLPKPVLAEELVRAVEAAEPATVASSRRAAPRGLDRGFGSDADSIKIALREVMAYCLRLGIGPSTRARVGTACAEFFDNVARHAFGGERGALRVSARLAGRNLMVEVADEGLGFDPARARDQRVFGGLRRAGALAEELRVESAPGRGTAVRARFATWGAVLDGDDCFDLSEMDCLTPRLARSLIEDLRLGSSGPSCHLSPALAVVVGRLLSCSSQPNPLRKLGT